MVFQRLMLLSVDLLLMLVASILAWLLRENFQIEPDRLNQLLFFLMPTAAVALVIFPIAGLNRSIWRFNSMPDYMRVVTAVGAVVLAAVAAGFVLNRLDGIARSLPFLQFMTGTALLIGARVLHKSAQEFRSRRKYAAALLQPVFAERLAPAVLVVGISRLAEAYLQAIAELVPGQLRVVGLAGGAQRHTGRLIATFPVLGVPEDLDDILDRLEVHGVLVNRIVVAAGFNSLSKQAQAALLCAEKTRGIELRFLAEDWGLGVPSLARARKGQEPFDRLAMEEPKSRFEISASQLEAMARRRYWAAKRAIDCLGAVFLLLFLSPLMLIIAFLIAGSLGIPVFFWQQRPGLGGKPFRLYKFRTMRGAHDASGRRLFDSERTSRIGSVLRRLRLDELPQLFNILRGDMSFVGPRPLLPQDQSGAYRARLLIRPGLSGWAQIVGGREIAPETKAALDVWYVCNASLSLDITIALNTLPMLLFGERISLSLIEDAWRDLSQSGVIKDQPAL